MTSPEKMRPFLEMFVYPADSRVGGLHQLGWAGWVGLKLEWAGPKGAGGRSNQHLSL